MSKEVILTGLRSNNSFHLGNFLGSIQPIIKLQNKFSGKYQINMFVPDLHSFTTPVDHDGLYSQTLNNLKVYVAAGLNISDPDTYIYRQSYISAHSELAWILSCFTYYGELSRMTQFKDKSRSSSEIIGHISEPDNFEINKTVRAIDSAKSVSAGLFIYPILMAADILLYDGLWVPVGDDQRQHLELVRVIARRFNNAFGDIFTIPKDWKAQMAFISRDNGARIMSLKNPEKKMSKSIDDPSGTIMLSDSPDEAVKKVMSATTDSKNLIYYNWRSQPGITNLLEILSLLISRDSIEIQKMWNGKTSYGDLKKIVAEKVHTFLTEFQNKLKIVDEDLLESKLNSDEQMICSIANDKLLKVQKKVGLRP